VVACVGRPTDLTHLCTVAGIGKILGLTIFLETGMIGRFASVGDDASYCRMVDSQRLSRGLIVPIDVSGEMVTPFPFWHKPCPEPLLRQASNFLG